MLTNSRLTGRRLILMRLLWAAVAVVFAALYVLALPQTMQKAQLDPTVWLEIVLQAFDLLLGLFVFWRRSDDWVVCVLSLILLMALFTNEFQVVFGVGPFTERLDLVFAAISSTLLIWLFYIFPDGASSTLDALGRRGGRWRPTLAHFLRRCVHAARPPVDGAVHDYGCNCPSLPLPPWF